MFKKFGLIFCWFPGSLLLLIATSFYFYSLSHPLQTNNQNGSKIAEDLQSGSIESAVLGVQIYDKRPFAVSKFLRKTALEQYSSYIVEVSDKYGIDYRFIPAIAMKESGAGRVIVNNSYNAWGFENGRTKFGSWEEAIDTVGKTIKKRYVDKGMDTPDLMMPVYAPPAVENGGGWAEAINNYFERMTGYENSL